MTRDLKTIVLDFEGYDRYLVPYGNRIIPKELPLAAEYHVIKTDYVHLYTPGSDMEPSIRHDSFTYGEIVNMSQVNSLKEGVFAAAMTSIDGQRISQIVLGRLKEPPGKSITLWSDGPSHLQKKVLLLTNIAFLFRLTWNAPREQYFIIPR